MGALHTVIPQEARLMEAPARPMLPQSDTRERKRGRDSVKLLPGGSNVTSAHIALARAKHLVTRMILLQEGAPDKGDP